ncbi:MAG: hypothetical protein CL862_14335 [Cyanobium sp. NAT70]|nr:hypothetical protein [Cyanobium sp. NAT70]
MLVCDHLLVTIGSLAEWVFGNRSSLRMRHLLCMMLCGFVGEHSWRLSLMQSVAYVDLILMSLILVWLAILLVIEAVSLAWLGRI